MKRLILIALAASAAGAQEPKHLELSLKQAVEVALAPEGSTRVQLVEELIRQSRTRSWQARASLLPNVDAQYGYQSQTRSLAAMGIRIAVPIPGFQFPSFVGPFTTSDARISGNLSVFDFSSIRRYQAARTNVRAAQEDGDSTRDQVTAQVATLYMNALAAQAHLEAVQANVELSEALARLAENRKNAGTGTGIEVTRAQVQLANDRQALLVAGNQRRRAQLELLRAIGLHLDVDADLTGKLAYTPVDAIAPEEALRKALAARPDLKAQQTRQENARLSYSAVKMERLPSLSTFADYGAIGAGLNSSLPTRTYGIALKVPVFDGGRRDARRAESGSQLRQETIRTADLRQQVELDIRLALDSLKSADDQVKVAREGLAQAEREVEQAKRRYEAGVSNSIEPTDAQTRLARARDNQIAALLAHNVARINLAQAMGAVRQIAQ